MSIGLFCFDRSNQTNFYERKESTMIKVKTQNDIENLEKNRLLPISYTKDIQTRFEDAYENLKEEGQTIDQFDLEEQGEIIILQKGDDVRNLEEIGLDPDEGGLLGCYPEWVERLQLGDIEVYYLCIVNNNSNAVIIYSEVGIHDEEVERWLADESGISM